MDMRIEPRCKVCGQRKLDHSVGLTCYIKGIGYLDTKYVPEEKHATYGRGDTALAGDPT